MAYSIQRKQKIQEVLELKDETGALVHTLHINLDVDEVAPRLYRAKKELAERQQSLSAAPSDDAMEQYGRAIITLFEAIFGADNTEKIAAFYDSKYTEMLLDMFPFITEVVYPRLNDLEAQKVAQLKGMRKKFGR